MARPRTGGGTAAHSRCATRAALQAFTKESESASSTSQITSSRFAGLRDSVRTPSARISPPMIDPTVFVSVTLMRLAYPGPPGAPASGPEALLERRELLPQPGRQPVTEAGEVLVDLRQLRPPLGRIDMEQLLHRALGQFQPGDVDGARRRHQSDRRLDRLGLVVAAAEDPLEHAAVLAEAGPEIAALGVLAKPVDHEHARQPGALAAPAGEPVREVLGHVIAAERQHR